MTAKNMENGVRTVNSLKKIFPHLLCLLITTFVCSSIIYRYGGIFSEGTKTVQAVFYEKEVNSLFRYTNSYQQLKLELEKIRKEEKRDLASIAARESSRGNNSQIKRPELITHVIKRGETLWELARKYGTDVDTIVNINNIKNPDSLNIGQEISILTTNGVIHRVGRGESLWYISRKYNTSIPEIVWANNLKDPDSLKVGQHLIIPGAKPKGIVTAALAEQRSSTRALNFIWPVSGKISSYFGPRWGGFHYGLDIASPTGRAIKAAEDGIVEFAGWMGAYGRSVLIDHGNGIKTRYAHASRIMAKKGQRVDRGQQIAAVGSTGRSTGPHLHFEIIINGKPRDPLDYLP